MADTAARRIQVDLSGQVALVPKPLYAIVSDIFQEADFSALGIGTGS